MVSSQKMNSTILVAVVTLFSATCFGLLESEICKNDVAYVKIKGHCDLYLECNHGLPKLVKCPEGLHFNEKLESCVEPAKALCELQIDTFLKEFGPKHTRGPVNPKESPKHPKGPKNPKDPRGPEPPKDPKGPDHPKDPREPRHPKNPKGPDHPRNPNEPKHPKHPRSPNDPEHPRHPNHPKNPNHPEHPKKPHHPDEPNYRPGHHPGHHPHHPTHRPTREPPTQEPTKQPTKAPTEKPTEEPTDTPTQEPTEEPTNVPTEKPTNAPTEEPTENPTDSPNEPPVNEDPDTYCKDGKVHPYIPDPVDCHKFIMCANGLPVIVDCPGNTKFSKNLQACVWSEDSECDYFVNGSK